MGKKLTKEEFLANAYAKNKHIRNGELEIRGEFTRTSDRIECYCNKHDVLWNPIASSLYKEIGCRECAKEEISEKNSKTHEEFVDALREKNDGILVLSHYTGMYNDITVRLRCGHIWTTKATNVYHRLIECPYCTNNAILAGFNDLWTTAPEIASLLTNKEDGYTVSRGSGQKKSFTCPLCNKPQDKIISNISKRGFQCIYCGDGISYPNKFGRAFLNQIIGDDYIPEYSVDWCKPYRYDNYFSYNGQDYFLEMDGGFHYHENNMSNTSLRERQEIDKIKDALAFEHDVYIIRVDSSQSNCNYIRNSILNSELNTLFDLSKIDWKKCDEQAQKSMVKPVCDLYMSGILSPRKIAKTLKLGYAATLSYLKRGTELGWCDYTAKKPKQNKEKAKKRQGKPLVVINITTNQEHYFETNAECVRELPSMCGKKIFSTYVHDALQTGKPYKDFLFKFINLTTQN